MEPEDYAGLLEQIRLAARELIPRHGGQIARMQGDGLLALFGYPHPSEASGRQAVEAALELHAAVSSLPVPEGAGIPHLDLHSGVHAGLVLLIEGDIERGRFDVIGEPPNTAARLCGLAPAGEIWVSELSLGPHALFFEATRMRRMVIRGRTEPLNALRIEGRAHMERRLQAAARRGSVPLVGRQEELEVLLAAAQASEHSVRRWVLAGEPGIGKSRLLDALRPMLEAAGFWVIQGSYESAGTTQPLHAFSAGLRALFGSSESDEDESGMLQSPGVRQLAAKTRRCEVLSVVEIIDVLRGLMEHGPTALLLDDWQWADDASHQVLQRLAQGGGRLFVLQGMRTPVPEIALHDSRMLSLEPLGRAAVTQLVHSWIQDADPFVAAEIDRLAGGNPLFIEELCHSVRAGSALPSERLGGGIAWLNGLIASRLTTLQPLELDYLQFAAVAGHAATPELLARVGRDDGDGDSALPLIETLISKDFLTLAGHADVQSGLRFKHALTRDAVYATVEVGRRRGLHHRVAIALESGMREEIAADRLDSLARHYHAARVHAKAADFAEAAGDKALALLASDRARDHYTMALEALEALGLGTEPERRRWCLVAQKLGNSCVFDPLAVNERLPLFRRAVRLAHELQDNDLIARAEYWLGYIDYGRGQPTSAIAHCEAAIYAAQLSGEPRLIAQIHATLGQALAQAGRYERARPLLAQAVDSKRQHSHAGSRMAIGSAYTLSRTAYVMGDLGHFDDAEALFDQALALMGNELHTVGGSIYTTISAVHLWQGRWADAAQAAKHGIDIALRCRSRYLVAMGRGLLGCALWADAGDPEVLRNLRHTCRDMESAGGAAWMSLIYGWLVEGYCALGQADRARSEAARLLLRARAEDQHGLAMGYRALARHAMVNGRHGVAARNLIRAEMAAQRRGSAREMALNARVRAQLLRMQGQWHEAAALEQASLEDLRHMKVYAAPGCDLGSRYGS